MMSKLPSAPIRTVLVESRTLIRQGFSALLERFPQIQIIGTTGDLRDACDQICREQPEIVLYSLDPSDKTGLDAIPQLTSASPQARLVLLASSTDSEIYERAVILGAMGVVHQNQSIEVLVKAIEKVNSGEVWLDRATVATLLGKMSNRQTKVVDQEAARIATLNAREREIIALAGQGLRNKEIGEQLLLSEVTVRHHFTSIFSKLNVADRLELIIFAYRHRLAIPPHN